MPPMALMVPWWDARREQQHIAARSGGDGALIYDGGRGRTGAAKCRIALQESVRAGVRSHRHQAADIHLCGRAEHDAARIDDEDTPVRSDVAVDSRLCTRHAIEQHRIGRRLCEGDGFSARDVERLPIDHCAIDQLRDSGGASLDADFGRLIANDDLPLSGRGSNHWRKRGAKQE